MGLDLSYKGKEISSFQFTVERSKIRELCMAIGDDNPIFFDGDAAREAGYDDTPAPLTFPTVVAFWGYPEIWDRMTEMGVDIKRLLHAKEEYEYKSPIYPGDVLDVTFSVDSMRDRGLAMVGFRSTYERDGETVLVAKMTIIVPPEQKGGAA